MAGILLSGPGYRNMCMRQQGNNRRPGRRGVRQEYHIRQGACEAFSFPSQKWSDLLNALLAGVDISRDGKDGRWGLGHCYT